MRCLLSRSIFFLILVLAMPARADFNLLNIDVGSPAGQKLTNLYSDAYGFTPQQTTPAMFAPAQEVPGILQLAQAAGTIPLSIWMMRKLGMSYSNIISSYALAPSVLGGFGPGYAGPVSGITDTMYIQNTQNYFMRNILQVSDKVYPGIPLTGAPFSRAILHPYDPVNGWWLPPGIAQKYGIWVPPGQVNKIQWVPAPQQDVYIYQHKQKHKKWKSKKFKGRGGWHWD